MHGAYPYYATYKGKDGKYLSLGCLEPWLWGNLCRALALQEYIPHHYLRDHVFTKPGDGEWKRIRNRLRRIFLTRSRDEWFEFLARCDVPVGKGYTLDEVFRDPQALHREMVIELEHPKFGKIKQTGIAIKLSETRGKVRNSPASFGEHTEEILSKLGYSQEQISALREAKVIG